MDDTIRLSLREDQRLAITDRDELKAENKKTKQLNVQQAALSGAVGAAA